MKNWLDNDITIFNLLILAVLILLLCVLFLKVYISKEDVKQYPFQIDTPIYTNKKNLVISKLKPIKINLPLPASQTKPMPLPPGGGIKRKICFSSNRADGRYYQLYMMNSDGNNIEKLTDSKAFDRDPHFSYDGTKVAFASNRTGTYQIYILDLDTLAVKCLTQGEHDKTNPFWSPDDNRILFTIHKNGHSQLGVLNVVTQKIYNLTNFPGNNYGYGFSPDGTKISFESTMNNRNEIFVLDIRLQTLTSLITIDKLTYMGDPVFSPDGSNIIFSSNSYNQKTRQLYLYNFEHQQYFRITYDPWDKDDPIFSPDGTMIAYVACWENAWNIFVMDLAGKHTQNITRSYYDNLVPSWR